jgi:hypothetical protein
MFLKSFTLQHQDVAKWQGQYELYIPSSCVGDIYFINKPCVLVGLKAGSLSFGNTQSDQLNDTIKSINNSFPELKELKNGCTIKAHRFNVFLQSYDGYEFFEVFRGKIYDDDNEQVCDSYNLERHFDSNLIEIYTVPKLNHVIKWLYTFSSVSVIFESNKFYINNSGEHFETKLAEWNLDEELLENQGDDLIDFLYQFILLTEKNKPTPPKQKRKPKN